MSEYQSQQWYRYEEGQMVPCPEPSVPRDEAAITERESRLQAMQARQVQAIRHGMKVLVRR